MGFIVARAEASTLAAAFACADMESVAALSHQESDSVPDYAKLLEAGSTEAGWGDV